MLANKTTWVCHTWTRFPGLLMVLADHLPAGLPYRCILLGATFWSPNQVKFRVALPLPLIWITGHHSLLKATIQVTSDEMHKLVGGDTHS